MKQWGELNGDEDEVEYTWEELERVNELKADEQNDEKWLEDHS